jgi:hypothetical protein
MTINNREVLGDSARVDMLVYFFQTKSDSSGWMDLDPIKLRPTWVNNRSSHDVIAKRLDCFLVQDTLLQKVENYRSWVGTTKAFDHFPIFLEFVSGDFEPTLTSNITLIVL